jgi:hypothetical protein
MKGIVGYVNPTPNQFTKILKSETPRRLVQVNNIIK